MKVSILNSGYDISLFEFQLNYYFDLDKSGPDIFLDIFCRIENAYLKALCSPLI